MSMLFLFVKWHLIRNRGRNPLAHPVAYSVTLVTPHKTPNFRRLCSDVV
jgi:hypothetical protein